jgi:predicted dehydrogenase
VRDQRLRGAAPHARRAAALLAALVATMPAAWLTGCRQVEAPSPQATRAQESRPMQDVRFMTLDPGHFHAALVQREMYPNVSPHVDVFAPLGPDLIGHLNRIAAFNLRAEKPTAWELDVHTGPDFLERMLRDKPGNVVVISGRNRGKIDRITKSVSARLNVLADKPWILRSDDLPKVASALAEADAKGLVAYDIMTERFEISTILQRELVNDRATFGEPVAGTPAQPGVYMESVHNLMKVVSGVPNIRPVWFFDTDEQGEGLNDIGTHLVDLVQWTLFPGQAIDYEKDVRVLTGQRWPTTIAEADFARVTGTPKFPERFAGRLKDGKLDYYANTLVTYSVRGIHTTLNVIWDWEAPPGSGDTHFAVYRGGLSRVEVRQTKADGYRPEVYIVPNKPEDKATVLAAVTTKLASLQGTWAGVAAEERGAEIHLTIPDKYRVGHESHFAQVTSDFLKYLKDRKALPAWERPNMLAKYYVTTKGTELSRERPVKVAPRIAPK